ncbi:MULTISPECIES: hypothetical protein [unclassified Acinetobacter]|uniref:hypothetical protein n=1 Tax=unclassified Acinetobacter TaxID=196816 RepID=UPI0015D24F7B|nr:MULTISPECIES: hypothetical protein [unclassified Acinetobacter]
MTVKVPKVTQVPMQQPISQNNYMHPVWVLFFESLAKVANENAVFSMQKISGDIDHVGDEVLQISTDLTDMNALIAAINASLLGVDSNILNLQSAVSQLQNQLQALTVRVEALENAP